MKRFLREYFTYSRGERNGLFVLLSVILLMIVYLNVSPLFLHPEKIDFSKFEKEISILSNSHKESMDSTKRGQVNKWVKDPRVFKSPIQKKVVDLFEFDPNTLSTEGWGRLGFSTSQIASIKNYLTAGGKFRKKEDLRKMYVLSEKKYQTLEPYIIIPPVQKKDWQKKFKASKFEKKSVELNSADSIELLSLKGIGSFYAHKILSYREQLGGFVESKQLLEIWRFDSAKLAGMENELLIDKTKIRKVNLNTCEAKALKHPYLSWNMVNGIINYRGMHGNYSSVAEIRNTGIIDEKTYLRIVPYLIIE